MFVKMRMQESNAFSNSKKRKTEMSYYVDALWDVKTNLN